MRSSICLNFLVNKWRPSGPKSLVIVETQTQQDFSILEKLYTNIVLLGDQGINSWQIEYSSEFHMTGDSALFPLFQSGKSEVTVLTAMVIGLMTKEMLHFLFMRDA